MTTITNPEFMRYFFFTQSNVNQRITLVQKVVISTINKPTDFIYLVSGHIFDELQGAMLFK